MDIIVKKDILDELQSKGFCHSQEEAQGFLDTVVNRLKEGISKGKVSVRDFGVFIGDSNETSETLSLEDGVSSIAEQNSMEETRCKDAMKDLFHFMKDCILKGLEVQMMELFSFRLEEKKAQIVKDSKGRKIIVPTKKVLCFEPDSKLLTGKVTFAIDETFDKQIAALRTAAVLLVVPNRDFFVKTLEYHFEKVGWKTNTALSVEEAERYLNSGFTYLVILDSKVENYQALCEAVKCRKYDRLVPLAVMYSDEEEVERPKDFRVCGDEQIAQPFEIKRLLTVADNVLRRSSEEEAIFEQEVLLQLPTVDKHVEKANALAQKLFELTSLPDESKIALVTAFREAVGNAAQHGNKYRRDKLLKINYILDKEKVTISVTNEGTGFDWDKFVSIGKTGDAIGRARERYQEGRLGGLGIMLMLKCVDKLEYNETGTVTTITKYLK